MHMHGKVILQVDDLFAFRLEHIAEDEEADVEGGLLLHFGNEMMDEVAIDFPATRDACDLLIDFAKKMAEDAENFKAELPAEQAGWKRYEAGDEDRVPPEVLLHFSPN